MSLDAPPLDPAAIQAQEVREQAVTWLVLSLLSSVLCVSLCLGLIGAVFCYLAVQAAKQGSMIDARDKLKWGRIVTLAGSVLGMVATALALFFR